VPTKPVSQPAADRGTTADEMVHVMCCQSRRLALCGEFLYLDAVSADGEATGCVVCADLEQAPCSQACPALARLE